ncbi:ISL3 family transposase [Rhodococcus globerulus]|uniref:ISL3 family transposase n=1 Tax=Rhodococcus globerulus TaxID=33008 RepID=UPI0039ECBD24
MNQTTNLVADTICRTVELGVTITGAAIGETITHIDCRPVEHDPACPTCGQSGRLRDHVTRVLADLPIVGHPTRLHVRLPRFTCSDPGCGVSVFRQRIDRVAAPKASITRRTTRWILHCLAVEKMSVSAVAKALGVGWDVVNSLALSTVRELAYNQPGHLDGVRILGVDEHKWKHVRGQGDPSFVTVIVDLTPVIDGTGPARLLDMVAGRSAAALTRWLTARDQAFRDRVKIVAMDGFAGYHSAAKEGLPQARTVMDPFHVVHLAAEKLTVCRQRVQQITLGHRGRSGDPLYGIKRVLLTRKILRTDKQKARLEAVFADEQHIDVEVTEHIYQDLVAAYADPSKRAGKLAMFKMLKRLKSGVPTELAELAQLGRSLWKRRKEILAYFDTGASNGPVEAINGRLEHLRGIALGFRNLDHYIVRSLIHSGQLRERINAL